MYARSFSPFLISFKTIYSLSRRQYGLGGQLGRLSQPTGLRPACCKTERENLPANDGPARGVWLHMWKAGELVSDLAAEFPGETQEHDVLTVGPD